VHGALPNKHIKLMRPGVFTAMKRRAHSLCAVRWTDHGVHAGTA
jgi:hypothetical protein